MRRRAGQILLSAVLAGALVVPAIAQDATGGGLTFDMEYTASLQGLASGDGAGGVDYGGKVDGFVGLDTEKLGLWRGGGLKMHLEYRHGPASAFRGGALWPVNTAQGLPLGSPQKLVASSLYLTQKFGDRFSMLLGKINVLDLLAPDPFYGGWGNRRFMNVAFVAPPSGLLPPVIFGAIGNLRGDPVAWTFMVYDPNDRTNEYTPGDLFSDGVNLSASGTVASALAGRTTRYTFGAIYSTKDTVAPADALLPPSLRIGAGNGSYNLSFQFSHFLRESPERPGDGWGVFVKAGLNGGGFNPIKGYVTGGIGGTALFEGRPQDQFGLGYFHYGFSDGLTDALDPTLRFGDERGLEAFYSYAVTPRMDVTGDVQYIDPAVGSVGNALVVALRANIRF